MPTAECDCGWKETDVSLPNLQRALDNHEKFHQDRGTVGQMKILDPQSEKQRKPQTTIAPGFAGANPRQTSTTSFNEKGQVVRHEVTSIR